MGNPSCDPGRRLPSSVVFSLCNIFGDFAVASSVAALQGRTAGEKKPGRFGPVRPSRPSVCFPWDPWGDAKEKIRAKEAGSYVELGKGGKLAATTWGGILSRTRGNGLYRPASKAMVL